MKSTTVATEILEISKRDISDEEKIKLIAMIVQDYGEDLMSDHCCSHNVIY